MNIPKSLKYKKIIPDAKILRTPGNAGYDVWNPRNETIIKSKEITFVYTGLCFDIDEDWVLIAKERGSLGSKRIAVRSGIIDENFIGELVIMLHNLTDEEIIIDENKAIAQLLYIYCPYIPEEEVHSINKETNRGASWLGSTDE